MRILVTGSSGFAGQVLVPKLTKEGIEVIGLDWKDGQYTNIIHDISKPIKLDKKIDVVVHLAARLEHDRCSKDDYFLGNVIGTENILKAVKKFESFFIYVSTTAIYGSPESPITEKTPVKPNGYYALTKLEGERVCRKFIKQGMNIAIVRPSVLIGEKRLGIFNIIFKNLLSNSSMPILGKGTNKISFVHIDDFTDFLIYLSLKPIKNLVTNFGGTVPGDLNTVLEDLKKHTKSTSKILHVPLYLLPILILLSKIKLLPVTPWQLSVMYKDYFYDNIVLESTGFKYKNNPIEALKSMADFYRLNFK